MMKQFYAFTFCLFVGLNGNAAFAQEPPTPDEDESAVRAAGKAYIAAFKAGDAKALAEFWSPEAVYVNRLTGEQVVGRDAIAEQFSAILKQVKNIQLDVEVFSIDFVSPNVAVETGVARYIAANAEPEVVNYSAVYVRRDGKWLLDRVTDKPQLAIQSNYEKLQPLEWMIGSWVDEDDSATVITDCSWTKNKNFITRSFTVAIGDEINLSGMQIIGWDAADKQIRSWTFDSDGGISEGRWSQDENRWYIKKKAVLPAGGRATATNIVEKVDDDTIEFQSIQRTHNGKLLPNVDEIRIVRVQ